MKKSKQTCNAEASYLDPEDLKQRKSQRERGGGGEEEEEEEEENNNKNKTAKTKTKKGDKVLLTQQLQQNPILGQQCQAESREVIKNLILVSTIIMLVAWVRHVFRYPSSSSVTTGT